MILNSKGCRRPAYNALWTAYYKNGAFSAEDFSQFFERILKQPVRFSIDPFTIDPPGAKELLIKATGTVGANTLTDSSRTAIFNTVNANVMMRLPEVVIKRILGYQVRKMLLAESEKALMQQGGNNAMPLPPYLTDPDQRRVEAARRVDAMFAQLVADKTFTSLGEGQYQIQFRLQQGKLQGG